MRGVVGADAQLNRLEALAARARAEAATKQTTHLDSIMGFGNRTLERLSALHDQLSKARLACRLNSEAGDSHQPRRVAGVVLGAG